MVVVVTVVVAFSTDQSYVNRPNTKKADRKKEEERKKKEGARVRWSIQRTKKGKVTKYRTDNQSSEKRC